ncbi:hypothetical protein RRF57_000976 [Xylaria bambusicola]|uniref:Uncharacterized protein n=1 Tax=Xylaria bambusicola TaxID=326684 RepID=A0AAN7U4B5_9PEZI
MEYHSVDVDFAYRRYQDGAVAPQIRRSRPEDEGEFDDSRSQTAASQRRLFRPEMFDELLVWCSGSHIIRKDVEMLNFCSRYLRSAIAASLDLTWLCARPGLFDTSASRVTIGAVLRAGTSRAIAVLGLMVTKDVKEIFSHTT